jgi:hypothetical protein
MIPDLSKCGLSLDILNLDAANKAINDAMKELSAAAGGIAGSIASLQSQLEGEMNKALAQLENLIPDIKLEFPNLQKEIATLVGLLSDPLKAVQAALQLDKIKELFGDVPGLDLNGLLGDLNALLSFDICKDIPNIDAEPTYDEDGEIVGYEYVVKGLVPDAPVTDAIKLPPPPTPKPVEEVTPAVDNSNVRAPITPELKEVTQTTTPPATAVKPSVPKYTTKVRIRSEFGLCLLPKSNKPMDKVFVRTPAPDGSGFFWKPKGYSTQLEFEAWMYTTVRGYALQSKQNIQKMIELNEAGTHNIPQELVDSTTQRLKDCVAFLKADGESNLTQATKNPDGTYSVSVEQAKLSWCPKPEGEWLGNFGIKVD